MSSIISGGQNGCALSLVRALDHDFLSRNGPSYARCFQLISYLVACHVIFIQEMLFQTLMDCFLLLFFFLFFFFSFLRVLQEVETCLSVVSLLESISVPRKSEGHKAELISLFSSARRDVYIHLLSLFLGFFALNLRLFFLVETGLILIPSISNSESDSTSAPS